MSWQLDQEVLYIGESIPPYKKGETGRITGLKRFCEHHPVAINIENKTLQKGTQCVCLKCGTIGGYPGEKIHLPQQLFVPLMDISELVEIIHQEEVPA